MLFSFVTSFGEEVSNDARGRFHSLRKLLCPLSVLLCTWGVLSSIVVQLSLHTNILLHSYLLVGSILSLVSSTFVLFSGCMASSNHRKKFALVYYLTSCFMLFAIKMFLLSTMVVMGYDLTWQAKNTAWCYAIALWGQISYMAGLGYTFVLLFDILFILGSPMFYNRNKNTFHRVYHISIWLLVLISCIPAMAANAIGLNAQGTCWFTGDYAWCAWGFIVLFIFFAFGAIYYLLQAIVKEQAKIRTAAATSVLHQTVLIAIAFILSWIWNWAFHAMLNTGTAAPHWLMAVQLFWLGGVGFNNALIWFPFIRRAILKAKRVAAIGVRKLRDPSQIYKSESVTRKGSVSHSRYSALSTGSGGRDRTHQSFRIDMAGLHYALNEGSQQV